VAADPDIVKIGQDALLALAAQGEGEQGAPGGVIRGADLSGPAADRLGVAWQALRDSLTEITRAATADKPTGAENPAGAENPKGTEKPESGAA
jgi:hypothetical protein